MLTVLAACTDPSKETAASTTAATTQEPEPDASTPLYNKDYALKFEDFLTVPALKDVRLTAQALQSNWDAMANQITAAYTTYDPAKEGYEAKKGDSVNIHYKGYAANESDQISEETLKNMSNFTYDAEGKLQAGHDLILGSNTMIGAYESKEHPEKNNAGFEEQLIGMKAGETRTITVTFPDHYGNSDELQGMVVKFDVTANSIKVGSVPTLTDEMVAKYTSDTYKTIADFKAYVLDYYKGQVAYSALEDGTTIHKLPESVVDKEITQYVYDYIASTHPGEELTDEETKVIFDEQYNNAKAYAEGMVKAKLILECLYDRYDIVLTWGDYKKMRADYFAQDYYMYYMYYGITTEEEYEEFIGRDTLIQQCKYEKLLEILKNEAVFE